MLTWIRNLYSRYPQVIRIGVPALLALAILLSFFTCSGSSTTANGHPSSVGGFTALVVAAGLFFIGHKMSGNQKASSWLTAAGIFMVILWVIPKFLTAYTAVTKLEFSLVALLVIGLILWIHKSGSGRLGWRAIVAAILLVSMVGTGGGVIVKGLKGFSESTGITVPSGVKNGLSAANDWLDAKAGRGKILGQREKAQSREMYVRKGVELVCPQGGCSYSWKDADEFVQVILIGEPFQQYNMTLQKVKLPKDGKFVEGVEAFINVTDLLTRQEAFGKTVGKADDSSSAAGNKLVLPPWAARFGPALVFFGVILILIVLPKIGGKDNKLLLFVGKTAAVVGAVVGLYYLIVLPFYDGVIKDHSVRTVVVDPTSAAEAGQGEETRINLVPGVMTQGGHANKLLLPKCKYRRVVITETIIVRRKNGSEAPLVMHLGSKDQGVAKFPTLSIFTMEEFKGRKVSPRGAESFMVLPEGAEIEFPFTDDTMIWFSFAGGGRGELEFSRSNVVFAYRELKQN